MRHSSHKSDLLPQLAIPSSPQEKVMIGKKRTSAKSALSFLATFCFLSLTLAIFTSQKSEATPGRIGMLGGLGVSVSIDEEGYQEDPIGTAFFFDYIIREKFCLTIEHLRTWTLSPLATASSFTLLSSKYYFVGSIHPSSSFLSNDLDQGIYTTHFGLYAGGGLGFGQSSVDSGTEKNRSSSGLAFNIKGGIDYNMFQTAGVRFEGIYASTFFGQGTLAAIYMVGGFYLTY